VDKLADILARLRRDDDLWRVSADLPCWPGEPIELWMFADEAGPTDYQRRVLEAILQWPTDLKPQVEQAAFEQLRLYAGEQFESLSDDAELVPFVFPELAEPSQIWSLIELPSIDIPDVGPDDVVEFEIRFWSKFDIEHVFTLNFENFHVVNL
jgi:hypothetical protein